jgi:hypothetical protein
VARIRPRKGARDNFALPHTFGILASPSQVRGRYVDLTIGDDLFAAALQVDLKEFKDDADCPER